MRIGHRTLPNYSAEKCKETLWILSEHHCFCTTKYSNIWLQVFLQTYWSHTKYVLIKTNYVLKSSWKKQFLQEIFPSPGTQIEISMFPWCPLLHITVICCLNFTLRVSPFEAPGSCGAHCLGSLGNSYVLYLVSCAGNQVHVEAHSLHVWQKCSGKSCFWFTTHLPEVLLLWDQ
jgi:hypothetical protein